MKDSKFANQVEKLHKTFDKLLRSKDIATSPSRHERDFGEYVARACDTADSDWERVERMNGYIRPNGDNVSSYVKNWVFHEDDVALMRMAVAMAKVAEANDVGATQFSTMFTMTCRMMKVEGIWAE